MLWWHVQTGLVPRGGRGAGRSKAMDANDQYSDQGKCAVGKGRVGKVNTGGRFCYQLSPFFHSM
jgi:hypothetical protein